MLKFCIHACGIPFCQHNTTHTHTHTTTTTTTTTNISLSLSLKIYGNICPRIQAVRISGRIMNKSYTFFVLWPVVAIIPEPAFCFFENNGFFFFLSPESTMEMQTITKTIYTLYELKIFFQLHVFVWVYVCECWCLQKFKGLLGLELVAVQLSSVCAGN